MQFAPSEEITELHNQIQHFLEKWAHVEGFDDPVVSTLSLASYALFECRMVQAQPDFRELTVEWEDDISMGERVDEYLRKHKNEQPHGMATPVRTGRPEPNPAH